MSKQPRFITIPDNGGLHGVFEIKETREYPPSNNADGGNLCPCCGKSIIAVFDVQQFGFWDDSLKTYFVCLDCEQAVEYIYALSRIEPVKRRNQRNPKLTGQGV